jgi:protein kinase A
MSPDAKDIISKLCQVAPSKRLGNLRGRASDIKAHPWFKDIDWSKMYNRQLEAPIKPHVSSATDTRNFEEYDDEPPRRVVYTQEMRKKYDASFDSF